ncbi:MAG TPA: hypothetical protein VFP31_04260 [Gaiellaceae bacterium]|nr:hypothetical protein [Gaiellaceae bacterium]
MTTKSDFQPEEWDLILEAPMTAGMIVITAAGGGTFRETFALARAYTDARKEHGASELLDEIVSTKPEFDRHKFGSSEELHEQGLQQVSDAAAALRAKATPEETAAYRDFVLTAASKVAAAHKEDGVEVSPPEQAALDEVRTRLETVA